MTKSKQRTSMRDGKASNKRDLVIYDKNYGTIIHNFNNVPPSLGLWEAFQSLYKKYKSKS